MRYELYGESWDRIGAVYCIIMMTEKLEFMIDYLECCPAVGKGQYVILDHALSKILFYHKHGLMYEQREGDLREIVYSCKLAKVTAANSTCCDIFPILDEQAQEETKEFFMEKWGNYLNDKAGEKPC